MPTIKVNSYLYCNSNESLETKSSLMSLRVCETMKTPLKRSLVGDPELYDSIHCRKSNELSPTTEGTSPKTKNIKTSSIKKKTFDQPVIRPKSVEFDHESKV